jgi:hypothetical protein
MKQTAFACAFVKPIRYRSWLNLALLKLNTTELCEVVLVDLD